MDDASAAPVLDAHGDTLDHVVRAVAHTGFLPQALQLMLASPEHRHDPELLYRTRGVRGAGGRTLLMRAVGRCDDARVAEILAACPTPATRVELLACVDARGWAATHIACHRDRLDEEAALRVIELLLANGADPLAPRFVPAIGHVDHAIHFAAQWSLRLVQRLVKAGASIDGDVEDNSTLLAAAGAGTAQGARMILRLVALGACETLGNQAMIRFASCPAKGDQMTDEEVVAALNTLESVGCSLTEPALDIGTPLDWAAVRANAPVVRALLSLGAPATSSSLVWGAKHVEMVRMLLAAGALPQKAAGLDRTPLVAAALESALESAEALLAAGADVNERDDDGWTVLHYLACRAAHARAVDYAGRTPAQLIPEDQYGGELHLLLKAAAA